MLVKDPSQSMHEGLKSFTELLNFAPKVPGPKKFPTVHCDVSVLKPMTSSVRPGYLGPGAGTIASTLPPTGGNTLCHHQSFAIKSLPSVSKSKYRSQMYGSWSKVIIVLYHVSMFVYTHIKKLKVDQSTSLLITRFNHRH